MDPVQSVGSIEQTNKARELSDQDPINQLILGGPGLIDPDQPVAAASDDGLRPEDTFAATPPDEAPPVATIAAPEVGPQVAQAADDVVLPVDGRGAAVALQEYLKDILDNQDNSKFAAAAQALGVQDVAEFEKAVEQGFALQTFGQVDSNRVVLTDSNFNEVSPDNLAAVAKAQLVIKPSFEAPIAPEVEAPEAIDLNPNLKIQEQLETPILENPVLQQEQLQTQPQLAQQTDAAPFVG